MSMMHLCELCHFYGGYFAPDSAYLCNAPEASKLMNAPKAFDCGKDEPKEICRHFELRGDAE